MITWDNNWINLYESPWSILEKIKYVNEITIDDLVEVLEFNPSLKENSNVFSTCTDLIKQIEIQLNEAITTNFYEDTQQALGSFFNENDLAKYFRPFVTYCPICIKEGYHSIYHQLIFKNECFIHHVPLKIGCPNCGGKIPFNKPASRLKGFTCICHYNYLAKSSFTEVVASWNDFSSNQYRLSDLLSKSELEKHSYLYYLEPAVNHLQVDDINKKSIISKDIRTLAHAAIQIKAFSCTAANAAIEKDLNYLYTLYINAYKAIAKHLRNVTPSINNYVSHLKSIELLLKHNLGNNSNYTYQSISVEGFAYLMWRTDVEGHHSYSSVHSRLDYRELNANFDAMKNILNHSKLFYFFYKEYKKQSENKLHISDAAFWESLEYVMYAYLWTHYQNWYKHAQFLKRERAAEGIDVNQSIAYQLLPILVEEIDNEMQLYFLETKYIR